MQEEASTARPSREEVLEVMLDVLCEKTGYDPAEIEYDFELEADLGVDTVKQAEILADVREKWGLEKDEDFRFSEYPTLERLADYVEERFEAGAFDGAGEAGSEEAEKEEAGKAARAPEGESDATLKIEGDDRFKVAGGRPDEKREISRHDIPASVCISGGSLGLPGLDEIFDDEAVERLLDGDNFIGQLPDEVRRKIVDKHITRLQKHEDGGGELVEVTDIEEVIQLAAQAGDFDLGEEWSVPTRLTEALDKTSQLAFAAGLEALRDAGLPLVPQYRETRSGKKITDGWKLPDEVGDETGIIFATAFAGQDAFAEELEAYHTDEDYEFNHRLLLRILGIANSRFAEYVGARGPNTKINNACASTTTALGIAQDWIEQGRCERVVVLSADDATGDAMMEWVGSGFLATGAATTEEDIEDAALPFDKRRNGMIVGMGAVGLVVEQDGLPEARGVEPLADLMSTHFVNSGYHPTRLDVDHIAGQVGEMLGEVETDFELDRTDIAKNTVFVSHETYTPARGGSADAEIAAIRDNFGEAAEDLVIANTKGYTGHAQGASIEEILAVKSLQHRKVPAIANFEQPDPNLGNLRLSEGGDYPVDYALRLAAGFGSQLALALYRFRARHTARLVDEGAYLRWLADVTDFDHPELEVDHRTLKVNDGQPEDRPTPPTGGGQPTDAPASSEETASTPTPEPTIQTPGNQVRASDTEETPSSARIRTSAADAERFPTESILVEADTSAAYDPIKLNERLDGQTVVILAGPMLVTNLMRRAAERCGAEVHCIEASDDRNPLGSDETVCDLYNEEAIGRELDELGKVDGIVNLLGFGQEKYEGETVNRVARQTFHVARAWQKHLGEDPGEDHFFVSVTGMGGRLGFDQATSPLPVCGAVCGLTKAIGREWADADVRVVDVPRDGLYPDLGLQILAETFADTPSLEVGLLGGVRYLPVAVPADEIIGHGAGGSLAPNEDSVILLAGGGKGITARVAVDLADRYGCKLALVGRTTLDHPDPLGVDMDRAKEKAKERIAERGERVTPVLVQKELKPLKSQRTVVSNMEEMRELGAEVEYFSCDVAEEEAVDELVSRVVDRFGTVDGVIHGAGAEISEMLTDKSAETFDIVFRGKALGGLNLWNAVAQHNPTFFVTFSSVVARFGNVAQSDYASANEVLNKLVAHINATTDVGALSFDWTAWDEVGMAVDGSIKTILEHRGVEFLPPEIGAPMVADSLEKGLSGEVMVAGELGELSGPFRLRRDEPGTTPVDQGERLVFAGNVTEQSDEHVVVERVFDPERDRFLNDHVYEGNPVLPGVMGFEMMANAARTLTGREPTALSEVGFERAVKLHHGDPIRVIATARSEGDGEVAVTIETERTVKTGRTIRNEHFAGRVHFDDLSRRRTDSFAFDSTDDYDAGPDKPEIYRRFFHEGTFQVMESVPHLGEEVVIGYGRKPTAKLVADEARGKFITDPMVREMAFQTTGLWGMIHNRTSYLPFKIGRSIQFGEAEAGERICIRAHRRAADDTDHTIAFDVEVRTDDGRLLQWMEQVELVGHRTLDEEESFGAMPARRMTLDRMSHPEAQAVLSDRNLALDEVLTDSESTDYERLRSERRRGEWLAARVAAKELVSRYSRDFAGYRPDLGSIAVVKDEHGAPSIELRGEAREVLAEFPVPNLTLTHAGGVAIAGIAGPGSRARIGIDLEGIEQRDESFAENYFTDGEQALELVDADGNVADRSTTLTALWSVKESVSKALGLGLKLALGELLVDDLRRENGHIVADMSLNGEAKEAYDELGATSLEVRVRVDGAFALASAHIGLEEADRPADSSEASGSDRTGANGSNGHDEARGETGPDKEFAAVAALLKHKGLLDAERTHKKSTEPKEKKGDDVSSWKNA